MAVFADTVWLQLFLSYQITEKFSISKRTEICVFHNWSAHFYQNWLFIKCHFVFMIEKTAKEILIMETTIETSKTTKKLIIAALMAAFTCVATMIIKIPTPTFGYIHLGDGLVLLSGIVLGPVSGSLAAGIGSMFADIFSGYVSWAPATFLIKALTAGAGGLLFHMLNTRIQSKFARSAGVIFSGLIGEAIMVIGYFLYEAGLAAFASGGFSKAALWAGIASSATGIPFNIVQGMVGIVICLVLLPVLLKIPNIRDWILD